MSRKEIVKKTSQKTSELVDNLRRQAASRKRKEAAGNRNDCGVWRRGLDQSSISGLQSPFAPETPIKRFLALTNSTAEMLFKIPSAEKMSWGSFLKDLKLITSSAAKTNILRLFDRVFPFRLLSTVVPQRMSPVPLLSFHTLTSPAVLGPAKGMKNQLLKLKPETARVPIKPASSSTMVVSDDGITIKLSTAGYSKENISVEVESGWLVIEALSTSEAETGGYLQRHMMRRYEIPPLSDVQNIKVELNEKTRELKVHIPAVKPRIKS